MDALHLARRAGKEPDENAWRVQTALIEFLESAWTEPDEGIWEVVDLGVISPTLK